MQNKSKPSAEKFIAEPPVTAGASRIENSKEKTALDDLSLPEQKIALDAFAVLLKLHYCPPIGKKALSQDEVMEKVSEALVRNTKTKKSFSRKSFESFLKALYEDGLLKVIPRVLPQASEQLQHDFGLKSATVVSDSSIDRFAEVAAERFVHEIGRISTLKKKLPEKDRLLSIGLVSGTFVQAAIEWACSTEQNWQKCFGEYPKTFIPIKIFPLNVSFADPKHLSGNATILAHKLAEKINREAGDEKAEAYGLNAPLMVKKSALPEVDAQLPTKTVLSYTEPCRLMSGDAKEKARESTRLDVVLTGVGERPPRPGTEEKGSIFFKLALESNPNIAYELKEQHVVGDLAFIPLRADGQQGELKDAEGQEIVFYGAIELPIFEAIARNDDKAVILVARSTDVQNKVPVIYASIGGASLAGGNGCRYVSHLVTDERTARGVLSLIDPK